MLGFFLSWLAGSNFGSRDPFDSSSLSMQQANAAIPKNKYEKKFQANTLFAKTTTAIVVGAVSGPSTDKMFFQPKTNKQQITRNRQHRTNKRHTEYLSTFFEYITRNILNAHNTHLDKTVYIGTCSLVPCHGHVIPFFPKNKTNNNRTFTAKKYVSRDLQIHEKNQSWSPPWWS